MLKKTLYRNNILDKRIKFHVPDVTRLFSTNLFKVREIWAKTIVLLNKNLKQNYNDL